MRIVWIGCHEEGIPAFQEVLSRERSIDAFLTLNETAFQKKSAGSRKYLKLCKEHQISYYEVDTIKGDKAYEIIKSKAPDLLVVLGWSEILPQRLLEIPTIGTIGTHAALLPHNRGSAPINWALIHGEEITGNTMMWLSTEVDAGNIIDQMEFPITIYDTCRTLYQKVAETNREMLLRLLENLEKGEKPASQVQILNEEQILPRRRPKDGLINWRQSGLNIYNFIRALTKPYPGAFTYLRGKRWILWEAVLLPVDSAKNGLEPGEIVPKVYGMDTRGSGFLVGTLDQMLLITEVEDEEGNIFRGADLNSLDLRGVLVNE